MAKTKVRQGICPNEEGCTKASNYEIQNVSEGQPFKCEGCGHELEPIEKKKKGGGSLSTFLRFYDSRNDLKE